MPFILSLASRSSGRDRAKSPKRAGLAGGRTCSDSPATAQKTNIWESYMRLSDPILTNACGTLSRFSFLLD